MRIGGSLVALAVGLPATALGQETRIKRSDLPVAVERAVAGLGSGATIKGFAREVEKGKTYYEVEMIVNGRGKDILLDPAGTIVELEEEVPLSTLPAAVQRALKAGAGTGTIASVESLTKQSRLVAYEAHVLIKGKRSEIQVDPEGKPLAHPE